MLVVVHTLGKLAGARSRAAALRAADAEAGKYDRCAVSGVDGREEIRLVTQLRGGGAWRWRRAARSASMA